ncbi:MAG: DUF2017 domain-containing protein [Actinomycetota bacterium]|nr:DUF2017 domain-containing protein [Actinomycetota bacterium]
MRPFHWEGQRLVAELDPSEAVLLRQVVAEIREVLTDGEPDDASTGPAQTNPVTRRLLPDGHRSDPGLAQDYRSLTEAGLRSEKLDDADLLLDTVDPDGGRIELEQHAAEAWLRTLNDVRLAIGVRLDVQEADDPLKRAEETGDPRWAVYSWLTAVQGLLVDVLADSHARGA